MISKRENLKRTLRRQGYEHIPVDFWLCDSQIEAFEKRSGDSDYEQWMGLSHRRVEMEINRNFKSGHDQFHREEVPADTHFDEYGIGHSKGSEWAYHMTRMHHPLRGADLKEIRDYPYPTVGEPGLSKMNQEVKALHEKGLASLAFMQMTVWEAAWYLRSMEELMMDMMMEDEKATILLDKITDFACDKARAYASAGVDILSLGDDIGTQETIMMDVPFWEQWLKPRLVRVIESARAVNPDILIFYHSCGYIIPFIEQLIEVGVDILNPVQPECMSFDEVHDKYGDRLSFWGTMGTQEMLPYGNPDEVREEALSRLVKCGEQGGLCIGPTHLVEPEVPWENLMAIKEAVEIYESEK